MHQNQTKPLRHVIITGGVGFIGSLCTRAALRRRGSDQITRFLSEKTWRAARLVRLVSMLLSEAK